MPFYGRRITWHTAPDGAAVASMQLRDGRTYRVVGAMPEHPGWHTETRRVVSARQVEEQVELVAEWARGRGI